MNDKIDTIRRGIDCYVKEQKIILRLIRKKGGELSSKEYDSIFMGRELRKGQPRHKVYFFPKYEHSFILGGMQQRHLWAKFLDLMQHMILIGIIRVKKRGDEYIYTIANNE